MPLSHLRPVRLLNLFAVLLTTAPTASAQVGLGLTASVGYFDVNLISGGGLAGGVTLELGQLYGSARLDIGFAEVPVSGDYVTGAPGEFGSACIERATGEMVAEVFCLGSSGFDVYYGAFSLEAGYALPLPIFAVVGAGVRSGEEIDRIEGKTVATRPYATALVRYLFTERLSGYAQAHLGPEYAQGRLGFALSLSR